MRHIATLEKSRPGATQRIADALMAALPSFS
jgi:hypothetical protein